MNFQNKNLLPSFELFLFVLVSKPGSAVDRVSAQALSDVVCGSAATSTLHKQRVANLQLGGLHGHNHI